MPIEKTLSHFQFVSNRIGCITVKIVSIIVIQSKKKNYQTTQIYSFHFSRISFVYFQLTKYYIFLWYFPCALLAFDLLHHNSKIESKMPENVSNIESLFASTKQRCSCGILPASITLPVPMAHKHSIRKRYSNRLIKEHLMFK